MGLKVLGAIKKIKTYFKISKYKSGLEVAYSNSPESPQIRLLTQGVLP